MSLLGSLSQLLRKKHAKAFETASKNPEDAQWKKLREIIEFQKNTEFGKKYDFAGLNSVKDYQEKVPVSKDTDLKPYLDRMVNGEKNVLTSEEPIFWGMTTGSTGIPKFIPITPAFRKEYQSVVHTFLYYVYEEHPKAFNGKVLYFNGSADKQRTPMNIPCGTMSGFNFVSLPAILQKFYALPYEVSVIGDSYSRFYCSVLLALPQNITMMLAITGAPIISFVNAMKNDAENLIKDLRSGNLQHGLNLTMDEKALVMRRHKANPQLAGRLEAILKEHGELKPTEVWKSIDMIGCWKSSNAGTLIKHLDELFEKKITIRDAIYSATEGWCNIPYTDKVIGGPLAVNAHFYEFSEETDEKNSRMLLTHELETGKRYKIFYTTSAGIYRYDIGDILEVTDFFNKTPVVKFIRKTGQNSNIMGELLTEFHVTEAVQKAAEDFDLMIPFYAMTPVQNTFPPYYSLLIELTDELSTEKKKEFAKVVDKEICNLNWTYKSYRDDNKLGIVSLKEVSKGSMEKFKKVQIAKGADEAQIKPIVLSSDADKFSYLEVKSETLVK